jgi:hypothetical protein
MEGDDVGIIRKWAPDRRLRTLITTLVLAVLAALLIAGSALAAAPGRPTAKTPNATSTVTTTTPTFKWSKAAGTATYEVRVYKGSALKVKKTDITRLSWKCSKALTRGVTYTWKVRGRKAGVSGAWSKSLRFAVQHAIGYPYQGGNVAYVFVAGDPGYVAGETHGLIAAPADQSTGIIWAIPANQYTAVPAPGATGTALGTGLANTNAIATQNGTTLSTYAAGLCYNLVSGGYSDWYLPSKDELNKLYLNCVAIGGFDTFAYPSYWSSSEYQGIASSAWDQSFYDGGQYNAGKYGTDRVRAVRAF